MRNWQKKYPPYEGNAPYLYFAFSESDSRKVWKIMRIFLERGCRVWYSSGSPGSAEELLRCQARSSGAGMTVLYLSDAACSDSDTKSNVLVNQKFGRHILCLDPDGTDRRLSMGLRETAPHIPLYALNGNDEIESAVIHADGFSQDMIGEPVKTDGSGILGKLSTALFMFAAIIAAVSFIGFRYLNWFRPELTDEIQINDPVLLSAVREAVNGGPITEESASQITFLRLNGIPENWDDLLLLPSLERIALPQRALLEDAPLPEGDYIIELSGG